MPDYIFKIEVPVHNNLFDISLLIVLLGICNPLLEEWFWRIFLYKFFEKNERNNWLLSLCYSSYHFFVVLKLTDVICASISMLGICALGRFFLLLLERKGYFTAAIAHLGADFVAIVIGIYLINEKSS